MKNKRTGHYAKGKGKGLSRRDFLRAGAVTAATLGLAPLSISGGMRVKDLYAAAAKPKRGGTFRFRVHQDPRTLHHIVTHLKQTYWSVSPAYSRLMCYPHGSDVDPLDLSLVPDLAERWEMKDDRTYIFHLRKGVRFHNRPPVNGREFTSADVKFTFETMIDPKLVSRLKYMFDSIEEIKTPDKYTAEFRLKQPFAPFLNYVGSHYALIFAREVWEQDGQLGKHVIGTGPFIFEGQQRNVKVSFSRNPEYFIEGHPYLDGVEILPIPEPATVLAAFRGGQLDATEDSNYLESVQTAKLMPKARIEHTFNGGTIGVNIRYMKGPFAKKKVRQAIQSAMDLKAINKTVFFGQGALTSWVPVALGKYALPAEDIDTFYGQRDVEKAKRLLHEAGYPNGFETTCNFCPKYGPWNTDSVTMFVQQLKEAGIKVKLNPVEYATYIKAMYGGRFDLNFGPLSPVIEAHDWTYGMMHPTARRNMSHLDDPKLTQMLEQQMREVDEEKRIKRVRDIQYYVAENALVIPIIQYPMWAYVQDYVKDYRWHRAFSHEQLVDTWIDKA